MTIVEPHTNRSVAQLWLIVLFVCGIIFMLPGCGPKHVEPPAPPAVQEVRVAVPVQCEVAQVAKPADPAKQARKGDDIFTLSKIAAASRRVLMGENVELRAANNSPCPKP